MQSERIWNFSPGPCCLPLEVLEKCATEMTNWNRSGMSVMELSHRSKEFGYISDQCKEDIRKFLSVPDNFKIFFFQGGATLQYAGIIQNLLRHDENGKSKGACYVTTGLWSNQCVNEAKKIIGEKDVNQITGQDSNFTTIQDPSEWNLDTNASYVSFCQNETVHGFEFHDDTDFGFPYEKAEGMPVVCDMSSSIGTQEIDWNKFGCVYASAQKNLGPSGATVVFVREDLMGQKLKETPYMMDWELFDNSPNGHFNTPATYPIYVLGLNVNHMIKQGGIPYYKDLSDQKSSLIYNYIDCTNGFYLNKVDKKYRSRINVPLRIKPSEEEKDSKTYYSIEMKFLEESEKEGIVALKGHPANPGIRVNLYNAMPIEGVQRLIEFMKQFKEANSVTQ